MFAGARRAGKVAPSAQVNDAVRAEFEHRRRQRLLVELLDQLDAEHGPVDESLVEKYIGLLVRLAPRPPHPFSLPTGPKPSTAS